MEAGIIELRREMAELRRDMTEIRRDILTNFRWTMGTIVLMWMTIMGTLAGLFSILLARLPS